MQCPCGVVPFVVAAVNLVAYVAILNIGVCVQIFRQTIVGLKLYVAVVLTAFVTIILVVGIERSDVIFHPKDVAEMVALVAVERSAYGGCDA